MQVKDTIDLHSQKYTHEQIVDCGHITICKLCL
jgi:hypothetical protein